MATRFELFSKAFRSLEEYFQLKGLKPPVEMTVKEAYDTCDIAISLLRAKGKDPLKLDLRGIEDLLNTNNQGLHMSFIYGLKPDQKTHCLSLVILMFNILARPARAAEKRLAREGALQ